PRTSMGSLSEAARVFDADALPAIVGELAQQALPLQDGRDALILRGLTAVDGSLLPALPKMAWALWVDDQHRAAKMHVHFDVLKGVPIEATVTEGNGSETAQLRATLQPQRLYVIDRGYGDYQLFQDIIDAKSSFIGRIRENAVWEVVEQRPLSVKARAAGVRRDLVVWLGCEQSGKVFKQKLRVVEVATGKTGANGKPEVLLLATDRIDLDADLVALGYRFRWSVELFFRWLKCILGCRHLLSTSQNGVTIQVYAALIASLLIFGADQWPYRRYEVVAAAAIMGGLAYTIFSEWLNTEVRGSWAYTQWMPQLPMIGTGLAPLMQWLTIPPLAFWWARRPLVAHAQKPGFGGHGRHA
ncbi:MAG: IS4 family transposase, partial [Sphingomonadales bacterium]|nr:IS4 family transposase [Sphingomonadales bacterium]